MSNTCYICKDNLPENQVNFCNCVFLNCHAKCLEEFIVLNNRYKCNICNSNYVNYHTFKPISLKDINVGINIISKVIFCLLTIINILYSSEIITGMYIFTSVYIYLAGIVIVSDILLDRRL